MITNLPCPCCTGSGKTLSGAWLRLCDKCAYYVHRLTACPHEYKTGTCAR